LTNANGGGIAVAAVFGAAALVGSAPARAADGQRDLYQPCEELVVRRFNIHRARLPALALLCERTDRQIWRGCVNS
jgi:hypothetical protein